MFIWELEGVDEKEGERKIRKVEGVSAGLVLRYFSSADHSMFSMDVQGSCTVYTCLCCIRVVREK